MSSSIRWTLLGWTGVLLAGVLSTFGLALARESRAAILGGIDRVLTSRAEAVAASVELDPEEGWEVELSDEYLAGLGETVSYCVWGPDGRTVLAGSSPEDHAPELGLRTRGDVRTIVLAGAFDSTVQLSRSIAPELARLRALTASIVAVGSAVLVLGLFGGWFLARRVLAPVETLAEEAAAIGPRDLSRRLDPGGAPQELRGLATAFNATLDRVEEALQQEKRFTQDASHELRTPLAVIRTQAELALRGDRSTGELRAALEASLRAAERMTQVTEGLLALARADSGQGLDLLETVALDQVVRQATEGLREAAEEREVTLTCEAQEVRLQGNVGLLRDAVSNLVENGLRYNRSEGTVEVRLSSEDGWAVLTVSDTGLGIPPEARPHVFERFYCVDPARSRRYGGSGLGLAVTRWIVEAHAGSIEVAGREGPGSVFTVRLPLAGAA